MRTEVLNLLVLALAPLLAKSGQRGLRANGGHVVPNHPNPACLLLLAPAAEKPFHPVQASTYFGELEGNARRSLLTSGLT